MSTIALTIAYIGTDFSGFARQSEARTVQGELESALEVVLGATTETVCAGRTDAGVHALGQVVSCKVPASALEDGDRLIRSINALTPSDMMVRDIRLQDDSFSARFDAVSRLYLYRIAQDDRPPLFMAPYCWYIPQHLDVEEMRAGARSLIGEHDFASFCVAQSAKDLHDQDLSTRREVTAIEFDYETIMGERLLTIAVEGNAFLHSMVRVIVGTLVEVGREKKDSSWVEEVLVACNRTQAGPTAPAQGLTFQEVRYLQIPS
ncbi:MAG: tRNA pseudouridine(38-40) synthase TruA [Coriobacteriia bacterium]|nr:tRNA pseudouridine(38-40) synthase TruA [Coriobacteriia bacterium]